jgi:hypothetical protein
MFRLETFLKIIKKNAWQKAIINFLKGNIPKLDCLKGKINGLKKYDTRFAMLASISLLKNACPKDI